MKRYEDVVDFHGHSCPGLALGYRVSKRALREFRNRAEDEEIVAVVENNSCAVDAVQVMTGCTFGKGNLIFRDFGKQVYTFIRRPSGRSIRIAVIWERPAETDAEKKLWERYAGGDRSQKVVGFVHSLKSSRILSILEADDAVLFSIVRGKSPLPPEAEIFQSIRCESCKEKTAEPKIRLRQGKMLCIPCVEKKGRKP
jgi:formylmethanofuran dehydrogenase subunit E